MGQGRRLRRRRLSSPPRCLIASARSGATETTRTIGHVPRRPGSCPSARSPQPSPARRDRAGVVRTPCVAATIISPSAPASARRAPPPRSCPGRDHVVHEQARAGPARRRRRGRSRQRAAARRFWSTARSRSRRSARGGRARRRPGPAPRRPRPRGLARPASWRASARGERVDRRRKNPRSAPCARPRRRRVEPGGLDQPRARPSPGTRPRRADRNGRSRSTARPRRCGGRPRRHRRRRRAARSR